MFSTLTPTVGAVAVAIPLMAQPSAASDRAVRCDMWVRTVSGISAIGAYEAMGMGMVFDGGGNNFRHNLI